jgi:hypothetical protein
MNRTKAVIVGCVLVFFIGIGAAFEFWPKKYEIGQTLPQTLVFWNDQDAFLFLNVSSTGRSHNVLQEKLGETRYGYLAVLTGGYMDFGKQDVVAFHLNSAGELERFSLPEGTTTTGSWSLVSGQLQLTPADYGTRPVQGFRWDGSKFISVPAVPLSKTGQGGVGSTLSADDENDEAEQDYVVQDKASREELKAAGWHHKFLNGYEGGKSHQATLPITVAGSTYGVTTETSTFAKNGAGRFDLLSVGIKVLRLSGDKLPAGGQVLFERTGWQEVSKEEYERLRKQYGRPRYQSHFQWMWLIVLAGLFLWRFGGLAHALFTLVTVKGRVLKNMATSYSFPPATVSQFPLLDVAALDRYTRELEAMGFTRLLDFSLVSDASMSIPNFCRLFVHTRQHCFATVRQFFPKGKSPMALSFGLESCLQNGWTLGFANNKPQATSSLIRRPKAIGVCMPEATSSDVLQAFLKMRDQVCLDLGISPVNDDTLEAFIAKTQRTATEAREAVKQKSFATGLPEVYARKLSLMKTKPEYVWLGDYPKEAERRKQGMGSFAAGAG